jgi:hypothetical protein
MPYYKCFLCHGQPTFNVKEGVDPWQESHKHYMTYHFKEPEDATQKRKANR